jgi:hypothetical protein
MIVSYVILKKTPANKKGLKTVKQIIINFIKKILEIR